MYSNKMLTYKEYSPSKYKYLDQLKSNIDRKISKISWMIKQKYKHDKQHYSSLPIVVKHIGVQTIGQYHLNSFKDSSLMLDKHLQNSSHTKICSSIGVSTNDCASLNKINFVTQTQNSSDVSFQNIATSRIKSDNQSYFRQSGEDNHEIKETEENKNIQINAGLIMDEHSNFSIKQQPEEIVEDSLDMQFYRNHRSQQEQDEKHVTDWYMKQSLLMSVSSAQQQQIKSQFQQINKAQKKTSIKTKTTKQVQRKNKSSVDKIPSKKQMPRKQPVPKFSGRGQSVKKQLTKNNTEELIKKRQNIKEKIGIKQKSLINKTEKMKTQGSIIDNEFFLDMQNSLNAQLNDNTFGNSSIKPKKNASFNQLPTNFNKSRQITKKNIAKRSPNKDQNLKKIVVSPEVKQKMKFIIGQLTPRDRRDDHDSAIRSNLLKRIEQRNKPIKNS